MITGQSADVVVSARNLSRAFSLAGEEVLAVRDASVEILSGELVAIIGRSGSGKTTLLNLLGGLDIPSSGTVFLGGHDLMSMSERERTQVRREKLGFVFQSFGLLPLLSAYENVELPLRIVGMGRQDRDDRTRQVLDVVGLSHRLRHRPYELSGGEQQRVAIARAIVHRPQLVLADEPTAELDSTTARDIFDLLSQVVSQDKSTIVVATHDRLVGGVAHRLFEIQDGVLGKTDRPSGADRWRRPVG